MYIHIIEKELRMEEKEKEKEKEKGKGEIHTSPGRFSLGE